MKQFKQKRGWIQPEKYWEYMKLLASPIPEDVIIGKQLFRMNNIKPKQAMISRAIKKFRK